MPLPEGYLPREGDVLVVHCTTKYDVDPSDSNVHIIHPGRHTSSLTIELQEVVALYCRKWNEGDRIIDASNVGQPGTVIAVDETSLWIKFDDGHRETAEANAVVPFEDKKES